MTTSPTVGREPTSRQRAYVAKLREQVGPDVFREESEACGVAGDRYPNRTQISNLIDALQKRAGIESRPYTPRKRYGGRRPTFTRCTHEDYPCCGCDRG